MITCPNCGRENADNFNFCLDCGYDLKTFRDAQPPAGDAASEGAFAPSTPTESMSADDVNNLAAPQGFPADNPLPAPTPAPMAAPAGASTAAAQPAYPEPAPEPAPAAEPAPAPAPEPAPSTAASTPAASPPAAADGANCPSCSTFVAAGQKFCGSCGYRMDGAAAASQPTGGPAPAAGRTMFMHATDLGAQVNKERQCKLVTIDQSGQEGMTYTLNTGETVCGRVNGIVLFFDDPYVSPTHCNFDFTGDHLLITDKESLNGIYVRIPDERALKDGDHLRIGRQLFLYGNVGKGDALLSRAEGDDAKVWGSPNPGAFGQLTQILEDGRSGEVRLLTGESCNLGREQGEIVFPTDGFISGRHCSFYHQNGETHIKDLGSSNGTYVRVRGSTKVKSGDFVLIGNQMLRVEIV